MSDYEPFDQDAWLGAPPWREDDEAVRAWEAAHGHDVRLKCYVEFGCQVIEPTLERELERLREENKRERERAQMNGRLHAEALARLHRIEEAARVAYENDYSGAAAEALRAALEEKPQRSETLMKRWEETP